MQQLRNFRTMSGFISNFYPQSIISIVVLIALVLPNGVMAERSVLYGVSYSQNFGLYDLSRNIKGLTDKATIVRTFNPNLIQGLHSLVFYNGRFYGGNQNGAPSSTSVGKLYSFGFVKGDEQFVGNTGYWSPYALAMNSSGVVYASCAQNTSSTASSVGTINLSTGAMNSSTIVQNASPGTFQSIDGLTFRLDGSLFALATANIGGSFGNYFASINPTTGGLTPSTLNWSSFGNNHDRFTDIVTDPDTGDIIGATRITIGNQASTAFYKLSFTSSPYAVSYQHLGNVFNAEITGLTFGPPSPDGIHIIPKFVGTPAGVGTPRGVGTRIQTVVPF